MAYSRRRTSRASSRSRSTGRRSNTRRSTRATSRRRGKSMSGNARTIRIVVQTVAAPVSPVTGTSSVQPMRAQF